MTAWLAGLEASVLQLSAHIPLPMYVLIGEIIEEIVSPIPSQAILLTAGSIAQAQHWHIWGLIVLALIATCAKTAATFLYYELAFRLEGRLISRFGKYIGISLEDVEAVSRRLNKGKSTEFISLFLIRCLPILPSAPVSVLCGLLKINRLTFLYATFAGNFFRGLLVLLTGFLGFNVLESLLADGLTPRTWVIIGILALLLLFSTWGYWRRYHDKAKK